MDSGRKEPLDRLTGSLGGKNQHVLGTEMRPCDWNSMGKNGNMKLGNVAGPRLGGGL